MITKEKLESWYEPKEMGIMQTLDELQEEVEVCEFCGGTGEIVVDEQVYPGEPHMASIGTRTCICQVNQHDDE